MTKILLVDDENLILYSLTKTLKQAGADVTAVMNGKDALAEIRRCSYDICFLDVNLPDANGLDLIKTFQEISPGTAIIVMTALYLDEKRIQSLRDRGCLYLEKPFNLDHVIGIVSEISGRKNVAN